MAEADCCSVRAINLLRKRKLDLVELGEDQLENIADQENEGDEEIQYKVVQVKEAT